jgi:hypothetical protein
MIIVDQVTKYEINGKTYDQKHGNAFDRGGADSYYHRGRNPHMWPEGTGRGQRVDADAMTESEIQAYHAGYDYNEQYGDKKDWG